MILMPDLFSFAYVPNWYSQLDMLAEMSLPEPWRFKNPIYLTKNPDTPILERYIHAIFKKQLIDYKDERNPSSAADYFHIENEFCCFHTGLYTRRYKAIYACFDRNKKKDSLLEWYFRGFADELSPMLRHISPLPKKPSYYMTQYGVNYNPEWPIRVNVDHILGDEENLSRIPAEIREAHNLPLLLETAVELARRKAVVEPSIGSGDALRTAVIFFYISNEGVSLLENAGHIGLPIPEKLKEVLAQLHNRTEDDKDTEGKE